MSAQLSQHVTTRLLVAEKSENAAHELESILRDAGIATKLTISDDLAHIGAILSEGETDVVLLTDKIEGLEQTLPKLRETAPHIPLILLTHPDQTQWSTAQALSLGFTDVVPEDQREQLVLVVQRELEHVCQREHFVDVRRALQEAEDRCQLLLQGSRAAIAYVHEGMHIHANEGYLDLFGYADVDDLCAESLIDILSPESADELKVQLKALRNGSDESEFDFAGKSASGVGISGSMTLTNSQYEGEDCLQVTVRADAEETPAIEAEPEPDPAPAAATAFESTPGERHTLALPDFVQAADALSKTTKGEIYLLLCAVDDYGDLQSTYGLVGAENIALGVWQCVTELVADLPAARVCNHQFAIVMAADSHAHAREIGEKIRDTVGEVIFEINDKTVRPTVSVTGVEVDPDLGATPALDTAHTTLLEMLKASVKNVVDIPETDHFKRDGTNDNARLILRRITEAIENKGFVLLFQPIISLRGDSEEHYEVFLRMTDRDGNKIEPGQFLQTAIDNDVAGKIDRWVILQAIKQLSVHRAEGHVTRLTINLTCNSVMDKEFLQWLGIAIKAARLPSDAVIFQITEKDATTYLRQTREFIEGLRDMHLRASLSRFGLIDSPFETLRHLPVDIVKLDISSVANIEEDEIKTELLVENIKELQGAGKLTVVPMVENANVLSTLWQAGANYIQGHYLQEPSEQMDYDFSTEE